MGALQSWPERLDPRHFSVMYYFFPTGPWVYKVPRVYHSLLRIHRNLEIHPAALTELDSDLHLKLWVLDHYSNESHTMYNDFR